MTRPSLEPCPSCTRHIRVVESACPFCGAALASSFHTPPARPGPATRLSRAALYAVSVGALSISATQACGGSTSSGGGKGEGDAATDGRGASDAPSEALTATPVYGAPLLDAGGVLEASPVEDTGAAPETGISPPYGSPPPIRDPEEPKPEER